MKTNFFKILVTALLFAVVSPFLISADEIGIYSKADKIVSEALSVDCAELIQINHAQFDGLKIYKAQKGGFGIVSAADNTLLAYSTVGDFNPEDMAPAMKYVLSLYSKTNRHGMRKEQYTPKLLPTSPYHQHAPYNSGIKDNCLVGCCGTALSIIMKYHQWPDCGVGSKEYSYYDESGNTITQRYDYSKPFDWDNILDYYEDNGQYTESQLTAIANLSYGAAVAASTIFGTNASAGLLNEVPSVLWDNLYYDVAPLEIWREDGNEYNDKWVSSLHEQINSDLPVLYGGGAHAFVIDGYDENGLFHINWGWGGSCNGYFDLDVLSPGPGEDFSKFASALFWIRPKRDKEKTRVGIEAKHIDLFSGRITSNRERVLKGQAVHLSNFNVNCYEILGDLTLGVAMLDENSNIREIVKEHTISKEELQTFHGCQGDFYATFSNDANAGDYLSIVYKFAGEENWKFAGTRANIENKCPAYDNEVSKVAVTWVNENQFNITLLWDSEHDSFTYNDNWGAIISPKDKTAGFNVRINGETTPRGVIITKSDEEIKIEVNSSTDFNEDKMNIELISIPQNDIVSAPITISNLEPGGLNTRVSEVLDPQLISNLIVKGTMNAGDFKFIRNYMLSLRNLDISEVHITGEDEYQNDFIFDNAFSGMRTMKSILLPPSLKGISYHAFFKTGINEISIPSKATEFGGLVFYWCDDLMKVTVAQCTPPYCKGEIFSDVSKATLIVPLGAKDAYAADPYWNGFGTIIEDETVIDSAVDDLYVDETLPFKIQSGYMKSSEKCRVYDSIGRLIGEGNNIALPKSGIVIIVCKGTVKKILL